VAARAERILTMGDGKVVDIRENGSRVVSGEEVTT